VVLGEESWRALLRFMRAFVKACAARDGLGELCIFMQFCADVRAAGSSRYQRRRNVGVMG